MRLDKFTRAYIATALWASTDAWTRQLGIDDARVSFYQIQEAK